MTSSLKNMSLHKFVDNYDVEKLMIIAGSDGVSNKQRKVIMGKIMSSANLIRNVVENHFGILERSKYKNDILTLYDMLQGVTEDKVNNYFENMANFGNNDEAFLLFLLNTVLYDDTIYSVPYGGDENYYQRLIFQEFLRTDYIMKFVGFIRVREYGLDMEKYSQSWSNVNIRSFSEYIYGTDKYMFLMFVESGYDMDRYSLANDYNFELSTRHRIIPGEIVDHREIWEAQEITGSLFVYNDIYYVGTYKRKLRIIHGRDSRLEISNKVLNDNPFINIINKSLKNILPFLKGDVVLEDSYDGIIVNGEYVIVNKHNGIDIDPYYLSHVIDEVRKYK